MIFDYEDEDYWCDFGKSCEMLVVFLLVWYGEDMMVNLSYEYCEFIMLFDCGMVIDLCINCLLDILCSWCLDEFFNIIEGCFELICLDFEWQFDDIWKVYFGYGYSCEIYDDNQVWVMVVNVDGILIWCMDGIYGVVSSDSFVIFDLSGML